MSLLKTEIKLHKNELRTLSGIVLDQFSEGITLENLFEAVTSFMAIVGQIKRKKGHEKKQLVIDCIIFVLENTDSGAIEIIEPVLIQMIPHAIDTLIDVEKGKMKFNQRIKKFFVVVKVLKVLKNLRKSFFYLIN